MPRRLPWLSGGAPTKVVTKRPAGTAGSTSKRHKAETSAQDSDASSTPIKRSRNADRVHSPSTSPPPGPPTERFMDEGMQRDDKYRMVEDEFLSVAQQFTVHLHAAEYKRQEKLVKARKADAISSISRPVTGKMPDQTKRKVESINRAKTQKKIVHNLLDKTATERHRDSEESDNDIIALPCIGTSLHGLMHSPRRKAVSLSKVGSTTTATRAAAGYDRPSTYLRSSQISGPGSPTAKRNETPANLKRDNSTTSSDDEDDDLDAPIPPPKLPLKGSGKGAVLDGSRPIKSTDTATMSKGEPFGKLSNLVTTKPSTIGSPISRNSSSSARQSSISTVTTPRLSRVELARLKAKREREQKKEAIEEIPIFF